MKRLIAIALLLIGASMLNAANYVIRNNVVPGTNGTYKLGTASLHWATTYSDTVRASVIFATSVVAATSKTDSLLSRGIYKHGNNFMRNDAQDTLHVAWYSNNIYPLATSLYDLGSTSRKWNRAYIDTVRTLRVFGPASRADTTARVDSLKNRGLYKDGNSFVRNDAQDTLHNTLYSSALYPLVSTNVIGSVALPYYKMYTKRVYADTALIDKGVLTTWSGSWTSGGLYATGDIRASHGLELTKNYGIRVYDPTVGGCGNAFGLAGNDTVAIRVDSTGMRMKRLQDDTTKVMKWLYVMGTDTASVYNLNDTTRLTSTGNIHIGNTGLVIGMDSVVSLTGNGIRLYNGLDTATWYQRTGDIVSYGKWNSYGFEDNTLAPWTATGWYVVGGIKKTGLYCAATAPGAGTDDTLLLNDYFVTGDSIIVYAAHKYGTDGLKFYIYSNGVKIKEQAFTGTAYTRLAAALYNGYNHIKLYGDASSMAVWTADDISFVRPGNRYYGRFTLKSTTLRLEGQDTTMIRDLNDTLRFYTSASVYTFNTKAITDTTKIQSANPLMIGTGSNIIYVNADMVDGMHGDSLMTAATINAHNSTQQLMTFYPKNGYTAGNLSPLGAPTATLPISTASTGYYEIWMTGVHMNTTATLWEAVVTFFIGGSELKNLHLNYIVGNPLYHNPITIGFDVSGSLLISTGSTLSSSPKFMITKVIAAGAISHMDFVNGITYALGDPADIVSADQRTFAAYAQEFGDRSYIAAPGWYGMTAGDSCVVDDTLGMAFGQYAHAAYKRSVVFNLQQTTEAATTAEGQFIIKAPGGFVTDTATITRLKSTGTNVAGKVQWTAGGRQAVRITGLNTNCICTVTPDSTAAEMMKASGAMWCYPKADSLIFGCYGSPSPGGYIRYQITWF